MMDRATLIAAMQAAASVKPKAVQVEALGGTVYVRALTVAEIEEQSEPAADGKPDKARIARATARILCDENGQRFFDPSNDADVALISALPWNVLKQISAASNELNGAGEGIGPNA